jgi:hypothetical protein
MWNVRENDFFPNGNKTVRDLLRAEPIASAVKKPASPMRASRSSAGRNCVVHVGKQARERSEPINASGGEKRRGLYWGMQTLGVYPASHARGPTLSNVRGIPVLLRDYPTCGAVRCTRA